MEKVLGALGFPVDNFQFITIIRLMFALVCGGAVGLERNLRGRPAGMKTFSLVCVGATLVMITNEFISIRIGTGDAARMAAQVISGIGFLGAGTIMVTGSNQIKGLTTAAALWVNAAIGITIGAGFYFGAFITTLLVLSSSFLFKMVDAVLIGNSRFMKLSVEAKNEAFIKQLHAYFDQEGIHVKSMFRRSENNWYEDDVCIILELEFKQRKSHMQIVEEVGRIEGLRFVEEI